MIRLFCGLIALRFSRRTYYSDDGRLVETADIVVPAAHCEIVYEVPNNSPRD